MSRRVKKRKPSRRKKLKSKLETVDELSKEYPEIAMELHKILLHRFYSEFVRIIKRGNSWD